MKGAIGSHLFESCSGGVHGLPSGGEGAGGQHLDLLGMMDFGACVDHLLSSFLELLSELSELKDFTFNERVSQSSNCVVDELLIQLPVLEDALPKGIERGLGTISRSGSQLDSEVRVSLPHSEESSGACVVQNESHVLGFAAIVIGVCYDLFPFLLIYFLFCLSLCAAPCLALFAFLCACLIAYLCVVLGHILHDT